MKLLGFAKILVYLLHVNSFLEDTLCNITMNIISSVILFDILVITCIKSV